MKISRDNHSFIEIGEKLTAKIKYKTSAFGEVSTYKQRESNGNVTGFAGTGIFIVVLIIVVIISIFTGGGGGYYGHRGFYGGYRGGFYGGCVHSSCACAGSGRAGCSRKDFYGTNITTKKIKGAL